MLFRIYLFVSILKLFTYVRVMFYFMLMIILVREIVTFPRDGLMIIFSYRYHSKTEVIICGWYTKEQRFVLQYHVQK